MASESQKVDYNFSNHLTNTVDIVEKILVNLNAMELNRCARVCSFWAKIVRQLKKKRQTRSWTCLGRFSGKENTKSDIVVQTQNFIKGLYTEPDIVFVICTADLLHMETDLLGPERSDRHTRGKTQTYQELVCSLLPKSCKLCGIKSKYGIIGTESDCKDSYEMEANEGDKIGVSFLCLPKYDGVEFEICNITDGNDFQIQDYGSTYQRLILMMVAGFETSREYGLKLREAAPDALVAGVFVDEIFNQKLEKSISLHLLSIHGDEVQVASVIIDETIDRPDDTEKCIKKLKSHDIREENSFAFMLSCKRKGKGLYGESNVESSLFRKYFPETPLIGLFGSGEIGFEHVDKRSFTQMEPECKKKKKVHDKLYHSFTTVFVLVSIPDM